MEHGELAEGVRLQQRRQTVEAGDRSRVQAGQSPGVAHSAGGGRAERAHPPGVGEGHLVQGRGGVEGIADPGEAVRTGNRRPERGELVGVGLARLNLPVAVLLRLGQTEIEVQTVRHADAFLEDVL